MGRIENMFDEPGTTPAMAAMIAARITTQRRPSRSHVAKDDVRVGVWGTDLRYLLTDLIAGPERRVWRVVELAEALERSGFDLQGRPTKVVSDALRTEIQRGRVVRVGWGRYEMGHIPGGTRRRIRARSRAARDAVRSDW